MGTVAAAAKHKEANAAAASPPEAPCSCTVQYSTLRPPAPSGLLQGCICAPLLPPRPSPRLPHSPASPPPTQLTRRPSCFRRSFPPRSLNLGPPDGPALLSPGDPHAAGGSACLRPPRLWRSQRLPRLPLLRRYSPPPLPPWTCRAPLMGRRRFAAGGLTGAAAPSTPSSRPTPPFLPMP